ARDAVLRELDALIILLLLVPAVLALLGLVVLMARPELQSQINDVLHLSQGQNIFVSVFSTYLRGIFVNPGVLILLCFLVAAAAVAGRLFLGSAGAPMRSALNRTSILFALLLALVGLILTFGVEFLFIRDIFESRMNTVFKLY